ELPPLVSDSGGLRTRVDFGRGPGQSALRVSLEGAQPFSSACLEIGSLRDDSLSPRARQLLVCDANGCASLQMEGPLVSGLGVRIRARSAAGQASVSAPLALSGGSQLPLFAPQRGDVVITEIMKDPSFVGDTHGEWFEIQNITGHMVNIAGWKISDLGANSHTILNGVQGIWLSPGQRFVLGIDADPLTNGGVQVDYKYSNFTLGNAADSILLTSRSNFLVDQVDYDDGILWPDVAGKSLTLHPFSVAAGLNDDPANWCPAKTMIGGGNTDMGTPRVANDTCP
ncbi:MAG TPA: lamin tail domain-containing protein, partial [Planctomycetota bacterium]|nr:lamin tail domain-containing protein [Planctomycetota bacterium]